MTVNRCFEPGVDMQLACQPIEFFEVPEDTDPQVFKEQLIDKFCADKITERELLIEGIGEWLAQVRGEPSGPDAIAARSDKV